MVQEQPINFDKSSYGDKTVCVVIAAKNEERTITECVSGAIPFAHTVVVLDGRSTDSTVEKAESAGAKVMTDPGKGKGSALRMAINDLSDDILVFMDADGSHDPRDIPALAIPIIKGEVELCIGSRFSGGSDELSVTFPQLIRTIGNISMNIAINLRWDVALTDTLNGFRAVHRKALHSVSLDENRHTIEQEMVMKTLRHGYRAKNVPSHEYQREYGTSHIQIWKEWPLFVWCVAKNLARKYPPSGFKQVVVDRCE